MRACVAVSVTVTILLAACGAVGAPPRDACADPDAEPIRDEALAAAIRERLDVRSGPTCADLAALTTLDAPGRGIRTLAGLQHAQALVSLRLADNELQSADPVGSLAGLRFLVLDRNPLRSIDQIGALEGLFVLSLQGVRDLPGLAPLRRLERLERVYLNGMGVRDAGALADLTRLRFVQLDDNALSDVAFAEGLERLIELRVAGNRIDDLGPLVANQGFATNATLDVRNNCLVLNGDGTARSALETLRGRGVEVEALPQRDGC